MTIQPYPTVTPVFTWNWNSQAEIVINQGGTSSSKTFSIMQALLLHAAMEREVTITVVGGDIPDLKSGAMRDTKNIVATSEFVRSQMATPFNKTDRVYSFAPDRLSNSNPTKTNTTPDLVSGNTCLRTRPKTFRLRFSWNCTTGRSNKPS